MEQKFADQHAIYNQVLSKYKIIREEKLKELDILFFKALEKEDREEIKKISNLKKQFRDFPEVMSNVEFNSRDDLIGYVPECFLDYK